MGEYPECEKMALITDKSQVIGEFMDWLLGRYVLCQYKHPLHGDWPVPQNVNIQKLLAEFFEIDLDKVDAEKKAMLEELRKAQQPVEEPQDWYFTFGSGQPHEGHYHVIHDTYEGARVKMNQRFGNKWSMTYKSAEEAGVERWGLKELK
jgi:hypothetical protein